MEQFALLSSSTSGREEGWQKIALLCAERNGGKFCAHYPPTRALVSRNIYLAGWRERKKFPAAYAGNWAYMQSKCEIEKQLPCPSPVLHGANKCCFTAGVGGMNYGGINLDFFHSAI